MDKKELFKSLVELTKQFVGVFVYNDYELNGKYYRVFVYTHTSEKHYENDAAFEARGIMFEINESGEYVALASMPMPKFFNYKENKFVSNMEGARIVLCMTKEDGSLASSFMNGNKVMLKSKSTPLSDYAVLFNETLSKKVELENFIRGYEEKGYTVNLEYTAPDNQIVLFYEEINLTVLNVRNKATGEYVPYDQLKEEAGGFLVKSHECYHGMTIEEFSHLVRPMEDIEGYVVLLDNGTWVKLKTDWYCLRHNTVDSINPTSKKGRRKLFMAALESNLDDIKQVVEENNYLLNVVNTVEDFVPFYIEQTEREISEWANNFSHLKGKDLFVASKESFPNDDVRGNLALKKARGFEYDIEKAMYFAAHKSDFKVFNKLMDKFNDYGLE